MVNDPRTRHYIERRMKDGRTKKEAVRCLKRYVAREVFAALPRQQSASTIHRSIDRVCHVDNPRFLAQHIPNARLVELAGDDHVPWAGGEDIVAEIREFITGVREPVEPDRILATVLFTDIVASTVRAASLGDRRWSTVLDLHDRAVRDQLGRFRGNEINTTGDGFVAKFDGPAWAIRCAQAIVEATGTLGVDLRAGLHTGECEVRGEDLGGIAVHTAARVGALAGPTRFWFHVRSLT